ncbi:MAG: serine hydrolase domain-containing protein [Candidatus Glassbacteria bacterium]
MKRLLTGLALVLFTAAFTVFPLRAAELPSVKPEQVGLSTEQLARIDAVVNDYIARERVAGTVSLVLRDGKVAWLKAHGYQDREKNMPMPKDAIFRICSMSKPITSVAVIMLYEEGRFMLSDPVSKFIPEFKNPRVLKRTSTEETYTVPADNEITIRNLLTHSSGLTYHWNPELGALYQENAIGHGVKKETLTLGESIKRLARLPLLFNPGERYEYSLSIDVLGYLVEVVSGMPFAEFLRSRIFKPLGMEDTQFFVPESKLGRLATAYTWYEGQGLNRFPDQPIVEASFSYDADYPYNGQKIYQSGGGGLCSTAHDYARFSQMLLNGGELDGVRLLSPKSVELMTAVQVETPDPGGDFGLGFGIQTALREIGSVGQYGWGGFYNTRFFIDPKERLIGIIMSQLHPTGGMQLLDQFEVLVYQAIVK